MIFGPKKAKTYNIFLSEKDREAAAVWNQNIFYTLQKKLKSTFLPLRDKKKAIN